MRIPEKLIRVSKESFAKKYFDLPDLDKLSRKERQKLQPFLPTDDEREFYEIVYKSRNMPQLARLQRKMSVCMDVEVTDYDDERITFQYGRSSYTLTGPSDAWSLCRALEKTTLDGLSEMALQGCVAKDGETVSRMQGGPLKVDEIRLLEKVADKFFFRIFTD